MVPKGKLSYVKSRRLEFPPLWTPFKCHKGNPLKFKPSTTAWEIGENLKQLPENEWALGHSIGIIFVWFWNSLILSVCGFVYPTPVLYTVGL